MLKSVRYVLSQDKGYKLASQLNRNNRLSSLGCLYPMTFTAVQCPEIRDKHRGV